MKSAHLVKINRRRERLLDALLPEKTGRGEVDDPYARLQDIIRRVGAAADRSGAALAVTDLATLLEDDVPGMITAIRALASREPVRCRYCGETWDALVVPAAVKDPEHPGGYQCRDVDGCEARLMRAAETVIDAATVAAMGRQE